MYYEKAICNFAGCYAFGYRAAYKESLKAFMPSLELKVETEKVMHSIAVHILSKYELPIAE